MRNDSPLFFWIPAYERLAKKIAQRVSGEAGQIENRVFPDGERYMRIETPVRGRDVVLVGGSIGDSEMLDLFDLGCCIVQNGCKSLKILVPFYGYSTMERAVKNQEVVKAKTRARVFSAIPSAPYGNQVVMLDLHSDGIPFYFEGAIKTLHLYAKSLILREARRMGGTKFVLGAPDAGRAKWVESLANDLGVQAGFVYKKRLDDGSVSVSGVNVTVEGCDVVIYDDMIRSGNSIIQAARAYEEAGAKRITMLATHGLFTDGAIERIKASGLISEVVCTDSHPRALQIEDPLLTVVSSDEIFATCFEGARHG